jgi:membrane-associated phospholipid phosphatase
MPALAAPVGALAAAVGISRVVNGVRYQSDIAGGRAVGVGVGMLTLRWWPLRRSQPAAASAA